MNRKRIILKCKSQRMTYSDEGILKNVIPQLGRKLYVIAAE
jgi:hypothetical protein